MSYRLDPELDERLTRLVDGLPRPEAPRVPLPVPYRTPRWVLVIIAIILALAALLSYAWLTHTSLLPMSATLACADVEPFRCHDAAATAIAALGTARQSSPGSPSQIIVAAVDPAERSCGYKHCPAVVYIRIRELVPSAELVTVVYSGSSETGEVDLFHCRDGRIDIRVHLNGRASPRLGVSVPTAECN